MPSPRSGVEWHTSCRWRARRVFGPPAHLHDCHERTDAANIFPTPRDGFAPLQNEDHPLGQCIAVMFNCALSQLLRVLRSFSGGLPQKSILLVHRHDDLTSPALTSHALRSQSAYVCPQERIENRPSVVNVRGGMRAFAVFFWPSTGWTPRNEALMAAVVNQASLFGSM